jgi:hypothetical protein
MSKVRYYTLGASALVVLGAATVGASCIGSTKPTLNCGQVDTVKQVATGSISAFFTIAPAPSDSFLVTLGGATHVGAQTQGSYVIFSGLPSGHFTGVNWYVSGCNTGNSDNPVPGPDTATVP